MHERLGEFAHCEVREVAVGACNSPGAGVREEGLSDGRRARVWAGPPEAAHRCGVQTCKRQE